GLPGGSLAQGLSKGESAKSSQPPQKTFADPEQAADVLIEAASQFDVPALMQVFGPAGTDFVASADPVADKKVSLAFAAKAHEKKSVEIDTKNPSRATLVVGSEEWLAWQDSDGRWEGPVGEAVAKALAEGYAEKKPFHGYYFKLLEGQGPAARLGTLNYFIEGVMIGGFAIVAWPADYRITGVQTFIVSYDGVVYQK